MHRQCWVWVVLAGALLAGCSRQEDKSPVEPTPPPPDIFERVDAMMREGDTNGAVQALSAAVDDKNYEANRSWIFRSLLQVMLMNGDAQAARSRYLAAIPDDAELMHSGFGMIRDYYFSKADWDGADEWAQTLLDSKLPQELAAKVYGWRVDALLQKGDADGVLALVPACARSFPPPINVEVLGDIVRAVFSKPEWDGAALLAKLEAEAAERPELQELVTTSKLGLLVKQKDWPQVEAQFAEKAASLSDPALARALSGAASAALKESAYDFVDRLCGLVLKQCKDKPAAFRDAGNYWVAVARVQEKAADIPVRLAALAEHGFSAENLLSLYRRDFYMVMDKGGQEALGAMVKLGDRLMTDLASEDDRGQVRTMVLDGAFMLQDYERSLAALEAGIPGRDEVWHGMAVNKVKAHLAMEKGDKQEAVDRFREFMAYVDKWDKPEQDPASGLMFTKEMTLGRNAKRIGDILNSMDGKAEAARKAHDEARAYYQKALEASEPESRERALIEKEMAQIGAPAPAAE